MNHKLFEAVVASAAAGTIVAGAASAPILYSNCSHFNAKYPHGVGLADAHDHTKSGKNPVTTFVRNNGVYKLAMEYNDDVDRDKDHIACESH